MLNQKQRIEKFREVLRKYPQNSFLNQSDFSELIILFRNHPDWKIKEGGGIKNIEVIIDKWNKKAFIINRIDGTSTDISFIVAARGYGDTSIQKIKSACRYHIIPEVLKFKESIDFNNYFCPITNQKLDRINCHIDHYDLSFDELFKEWIIGKNIEELSKFLNDSKADNVVYNKFTNENIIQDFISFHNKKTKLRAVAPIANLSLLKKKKNGRY